LERIPAKLKFRSAMHTSISHLRVLVAVADVGSIVEAARRLERTPSAVSMSLKQLESEVGAPLFVSERKSRLTPVGRFTADRARELVNHFDRALAAIAAFARNAIGRVEIACVPSVAMTLLPSVISAFRERWQEVEIDVHDADSESVSDAVQRGAVEIGVASRRPGFPDLRFVPLFREALGVVCRHGDPLCAQPLPLPWSSLEGRPVLANGFVRAAEGQALREAVAAAPITVYNVLSLIALVRDGVGITVLPRLSISWAAEDVAFLPLQGPQATRSVGLLTRADDALSPAAAAFVTMLRERIAATAAEHGIEVDTDHQPTTVLAGVPVGMHESEHEGR
jgi:DNA-binding transcriptional LysR family regulator